MEGEGFQAVRRREVARDGMLHQRKADERLFLVAGRRGENSFRKHKLQEATLLVQPKRIYNIKEIIILKNHANSSPTEQSSEGVSLANLYEQSYDPTIMPSYRKIEGVSYIIQVGAEDGMVEIRFPDDSSVYVDRDDRERLIHEGWLASTEAAAKDLLQKIIKNKIKKQRKSIESSLSAIKRKRESITNLNKELKKLNDT